MNIDQNNINELLEDYPDAKITVIDTLSVWCFYIY